LWVDPLDEVENARIEARRLWGDQRSHANTGKGILNSDRGVSGLADACARRFTGVCCEREWVSNGMR